MLSPHYGNAIKVLLLDPIPEASLQILEGAQYKVDKCFDNFTEAQLVSKIGEYNVICLSGEREELYLTDEVLRTGNRLLAIGAFGRSAAAVDLKTAASMGIPVFTAPYQHQHSVAEMIISVIVLLARQIGDRSIEVHSGVWNKVSSGCHEVRGKVLGIIGYGHVGSQLGVMAEALGMQVIFYDTVSLMPIGRAEPKDSLADLLTQSDFVSINVSSVSENVKMFGAEQIKLMKKNSYLINVNFGDAVDLDAVADGLDSGHLAGAAFDCFPADATKGNNFTHRIQKCKNVILTPMIGK
ncbi:hypothetical protein HK102_008714 [Quaeritorhiza haematococci]|nr:hypothetical protein HK102_008714 [Quaeritorhiza haematococci]